MKTQSKACTTANSQEKAILTYSEFLIRARRVISICNTRTTTVRSLFNLTKALRAALTLKEFDNDDVTSGAYRLLRAVSRTPISGPSCYLFIGKDAPDQAKFISALEQYTEDAIESLRSGQANPDTSVSSETLSTLVRLEEILDRSLVTFDCPDDLLAQIQRKDVTVAQIKHAATTLNSAYYDVPEVFIEAYFLAHAYCYNLALLG